MKKLFTLACLLTLSSTFAQVVKDGKVVTDSKRYLKDQTFNGRTEGWFISGNNSLLFSQSAFDNWVAGGVNSIALNANVDYEFNLTRGKHIWDNHVVIGYGVQANEGESTRKTNDIIDLTSAYGYNIGNNWFLAAALNFKTQFTGGYTYSEDAKTKISNFMAPGYLSLGLGVDYKPNENFQVNIHPLTPRFTFVTDKDLQYKGNFGLKNDGDSHVFELGAYLGARYKVKVMEGITYDSRLGIFADYLKKPQNMDLAYQGLLDLKVNRFVSAQVSLNLLYDEDQISRMQLKQTLGIGLNYKFDNKVKEEATAFQSIQEQPVFVMNDLPTASILTETN